MTISLPMRVSFRILCASVSTDVEMHDDLPFTISMLNLVLLAERNTKIHLVDDDKPLSEIEVHFSISSKWRTSTELDHDLTANDLGFLCHTKDTNGNAFVHGAAIWPDEVLPLYLLAGNLRRNVHFTVASLPLVLDSAPPHSWGTNREHVLRLSSMCFNALDQEG